MKTSWMTSDWMQSSESVMIEKLQMIVTKNESTMPMHC